MNDVIAFLKRNGFERMEKKSYANKVCNVLIMEDYYAVANNEGYTIYSTDLSIYWLIGVLTYYGYIHQCYIK